MRASVDMEKSVVVHRALKTAGCRVAVEAGLHKTAVLVEGPDYNLVHMVLVGCMAGSGGGAERTEPLEAVGRIVVHMAAEAGRTAGHFVAEAEDILDNLMVVVCSSDTVMAVVMMEDTVVVLLAQSAGHQDMVDRDVSAW